MYTYSTAVPDQHGGCVPTWVHVMRSMDARGIPSLEGRLPVEGARVSSFIDAGGVLSPSPRREVLALLISSSFRVEVGREYMSGRAAPYAESVRPSTSYSQWPRIQFHAAWL